MFTYHCTLLWIPRLMDTLTIGNTIVLSIPLRYILGTIGNNVQVSVNRRIFFVSESKIHI